MKKNIMIFIILCTLLFTLYSSVCADSESDFQDFLGKLRSEGLISEKPGSIIRIGDFSDELANLGCYSWFPLTNAENFVLSSKISWESGNEHPNSGQAGCGVVYGADPVTNYHVMASIRMDGTVYMSGFNQTGNLKYGNNYYGLYSYEGSADFAVVVNGMNVYIYVNGKQIMDRHSIYTYGTGVGPAVISGSNWKFGNRCTWADTYLYVY